MPVLSLSAFGNKGDPVHLAVPGSEKMIIENLINLHLLPARFTFIALPLRAARLHRCRLLR